MVLGCSRAYGMHVCQFQYSLNHMQIYKHEYIYINKINHTKCYEIIISNTKISSLGLMSKHKQFDSNYLTKHGFSRKYISWVTIPRNSKTLGFTVPDTQLILGSCFEPAFHGHYQPKVQPIHDSNHHTPFSYPHGHGAATGCSIWFQKNCINSVPCFGTDPTAPKGLNRLKHSKNTKNGNKTQVGRKSYLEEFEETH